MVDLLELLLRFMVPLHGGFVLGVTLWVMWAYWPAPPHLPPRYRHVCAIGASYTILTFVFLIRFFMLGFDLPAWMITMAFLAFLLGDYALIQLMYFWNESHHPVSDMEGAVRSSLGGLEARLKNSPPSHGH